MSNGEQPSLENWYDPNDPFAARRQRRPIANRYQEFDEDSFQLASRCGKLCETVISSAWSGNLPEDDYDQLFNAEQIIRQEIQSRKIERISQLQKQLEDAKCQLREDPNNKELIIKIKELKSSMNFSHNFDIKHLYQHLANPPLPLSEPSEARAVSMPTNPILHKLLSEADRIFGSNLLNELETIGNDEVDATKVNIRIKILVETALFIASTARNRSRLKDYLLLPNIWVGNSAQFDGILIPNSEVEKNIDSDDDPPDNDIYHEPWRHGIAYSVLEIKTDNRSYALHGNRNNNNTPQRHVNEMKKKLTRIAFETADFRLPDSYIFVHPRGTENTIIHKVPLDIKFLTDWKRGLIFALDNDRIPMFEIEKTHDFIKLIDDRINFIQLNEKRKRELLDRNMPTEKLEQVPVLDLKTYTNPEKSEHKNKVSKPKSVVSLWSLQSLKKQIMMQEKLINKLEINFGGNSFYKIAEFIRNLSLNLEYEDNEQHIFNNSKEMYGWLCDMYKCNPSGQVTPDKFTLPGVTPKPYIDKDKNYVFDYSIVDARYFILMFGGQLLLHLRENFPKKKYDEIYTNEFQLLHLVAEKLKGRSMILLFNWANSDGSRDLIGMLLKIKEIADPSPNE